MHAKDRGNVIEDILAQNGKVSVDELAQRLGVTASTIRRDLARLTRAGKISRTYGGAVVSAAAGVEASLYQRSRLARSQKDAIGRWAAAEVRPGETIILDAGTTTGRVAHHLRGHSDLTIITNGLSSVIELADSDDVKVVVLGGTMRHISQSFVGPLTELSLSRLTADRVFLGADGLLADRGICEASLGQTRVKELMAARAKKTYVLTDSSKLGHAPFHAWMPLTRPWTLVTDEQVTPDQLAPFRAEGIDVVIAPGRAAASGH